VTAEVRNILLGAVVLLCAILVAHRVYAQDGHARYHHYYLHWKQPGTTISCCNARTMQFGVESGDCEPTRMVRKEEELAVKK
jgi:hypothetical protein